MDTNKFFEVAESALETIAPALPGPGGLIALGLSAAVGLVGDLIKLGMNAKVEIQEIRSSIQDFQAAKDRLEQKLRTKFPEG